jgi:outer membrane protein insertion porin family/translocation and assembly module TamA
VIAAPSARPICLAVAALLLAAAPAAAQSERCGATDPEVGWLRFRGNLSFDADELGNAIVTTPSSWARRAFRFIGTRRCLDADEFARDRVRFEILYRKHGYRQATVDTLVRALRPGVVGVAFTIHEGLPVVIDSLTVDGYTTVKDAHGDTAHLPIRPRLPGHRVARNNVFDQYAIDATRDLMVRRLQASGYPFAQVLINSDVNTAKRSAWVGFSAVPGPYARIRSVNIDSRSARGAKAAVPDAVARHLSGLEPGAAYSATDLQRAQRNLFETGAYRRVTYDVSRDSLPKDTPDTTLVDITLRMQEDYMHNARVGAGWGTLDCFRVQGQYTDRNFLDGARDFELSARVSKIGIGDPFTGLKDSFCAPARNDIYADSLNYNISATLRQAELFGARLYPQLSFYSERRSEYDAYVRSTPIGATASLTRNLGWLVTVAPQYTLQYGRTSASPALLCALFNLCQEADQLRVQREGVLSQLGLTVTRDGRDDPVLPHHGTFVTASITHSGPELGSLSEFQFSKISGEARWYSEVGHTGAVIGARILAGRIFGTSTQSNGTSNGIAFVPLEQRLYAGGPTTVRGFPQNQLGPAVYLTQFIDSTCTVTGTAKCANPRYSHILSGRPVFIVPTGGNTSVVGNAELRLKSPVLPQYVGWTLFVDAGRVSPPRTGQAQLDESFRQLSWTPGIGVQAFTPIGPVRLDVGYNPGQRPLGPAYYAVPPGSITKSQYQAQAPVLCVSPGNQGLIQTDTTTVPTQTFPKDKNGVPLSCPASYQPALQHGFFNHLTLNFSIGEAF